MNNWKKHIIEFVVVVIIIITAGFISLHVREWLSKPKHTDFSERLSKLETERLFSLSSVNTLPKETIICDDEISLTHRDKQAILFDALSDYVAAETSYMLSNWRSDNKTIVVNSSLKEIAVELMRKDVIADMPSVSKALEDSGNMASKLIEEQKQLQMQNKNYVTAEDIIMYSEYYKELSKKCKLFEDAGYKKAFLADAIGYGMLKGIRTVADNIVCSEGSKIAVRVYDATAYLNEQMLKYLNF